MKYLFALLLVSTLVYATHETVRVYNPQIHPLDETKLIFSVEQHHPRDLCYEVDLRGAWVRNYGFGLKGEWHSYYTSGIPLATYLECKARAAALKKSWVYNILGLVVICNPRNAQPFTTTASDSRYYAVDPYVSVKGGILPKGTWLEHAYPGVVEVSKLEIEQMASCKKRFLMYNDSSPLSEAYLKNLPQPIRILVQHCQQEQVNLLQEESQVWEQYHLRS